MNELFAAFGEADITPKLGSYITGWIYPLRPAETIMDPIKAHACLLKSGKDSILILSLDILSISISDSNDLRKRISCSTGIPASNIMVAATHSHTGPAVAHLPITPSDRDYVEFMKNKVNEMAKELICQLVPAMLGSGCGFEGRISFNRRFIKNNGIVTTHPSHENPELVCAEGPIDPQLGVVCVRDMDNHAMGYLINFACHPCFYGGLNIISANYPGSISRRMKALEGEKCVVVFLNGACGDIHHDNPLNSEYKRDMEDMGIILADKSYQLATRANYVNKIKLKASTTISVVPLRKLSAKEVSQAKQQLKGEKIKINPRWQRFGPDQVYAESILELDKKYSLSSTLKFEIQALAIGNTVFVAIPAEFFVQNGMKIKTQSCMKPTYIVTCANGMIGYVGTRDAYKRGGYEVTPCTWSKVDHKACDIMIKDSLNTISELNSRK